MKRILALIIVLIAGAVVVAVPLSTERGRDAPTSGSTSMAIADLRFLPNRLDARVGVPLRIRLTNQGRERHDLNFPSLHMPSLEGVQSILEPGETRTITLRFDRPGVHTFVCSLPGHAASGMTGAVFVSS